MKRGHRFFTNYSPKLMINICLFGIETLKIVKHCSTVEEAQEECLEETEIKNWQTFFTNMISLYDKEI